MIRRLVTPAGIGHAELRCPQPHLELCWRRRLLRLRCAVRVCLAYVRLRADCFVGMVPTALSVRFLVLSHAGGKQLRMLASLAAFLVVFCCVRAVEGALWATRAGSCRCQC